MSFLPFLKVIYTVFVLAFILIFIKPKRIKELLPVGILSAVILFSTSFFLQSLNLYKFNVALVWIYGIPLFHLTWGFGSGMIYIHYSRKYFNWQFPVTVLFTIATLLFDYFAEQLKVTSHVGLFNDLHQAYIDFLTLATLYWISYGLWGNKLFDKTTKNMI